MSLRIDHIASADELRASHAIASQQYNHSLDDYVRVMNEMIEQEGYRLVGAYAGEELVGIVGYHIGHRLYCGKFLHLHNLIIDDKHRKQGIAIELLNWLRSLAYTEHCDTLLADTYLENAPAQALFKREGFSTRGNHLKCDLR